MTYLVKSLFVAFSLYKLSFFHLPTSAIIVMLHQLGGSFEFNIVNFVSIIL
jgi:hypothetical protein